MPIDPDDLQIAAKILQRRRPDLKTHMDSLIHEIGASVEEAFTVEDAKNLYAKLGPLLEALLTIHTRLYPPTTNEALVESERLALVMEQLFQNGIPSFDDGIPNPYGNA